MVALRLTAPFVTASSEGQMVCHGITAGTGGQGVKETPVNKVRASTGCTGYILQPIILELGRAGFTALSLLCGEVNQL